MPLIRSTPGLEAEAKRLHDTVSGLRDAVEAEATEILERWRPRIGAAGLDSEAFFHGHELLRRQTEAALGPTPPNRAVRIMVTLPSEAVEDFALVRELSAAGMDIARINCAHDDPGAWAAMVGHVRRAAAESGLAVPSQLRPHRAALQGRLDHDPRRRAGASR